MALCGYSVFTSKTQGNILNNFPKDDLWANVARLCFGANMFATLPLECFVCREVRWPLFVICLSTLRTQVFETFFYPGAPFDQRRHIIFTTALVVVSMTVSLFTSNLGVVLEVAGGCGAALLAYVFPAAAYLRLSTDLSSPRKWAARICVAFGIGVALMVAIRVLLRAYASSDAL
jgi:sodium-coupled neutral amino acid transporter 11